jgi:ABC-2 type transport system ATP-binding protein
MLIEVKNIAVKYKSFKALDNISFTVSKGDCLAIIGPNGAGKTTLLKTLIKLISPESGTITYNCDFQKIGVVLEEDTFYKGETVYQNLMHSAIVKRICNPDILDTILERFNLSDKKHTKAKKLSKGMKKKLQLCMAFLNSPDLLIFDEPTSGLDIPSVIEMRNIFNDLLQNNSAIIFADHHITEIEKVATHVLFINKGQQIFLDNKENIMKHYESLENAFIKIFKL